MYNYHISYLVNRVDKSQFLRVPSTALLKLSHVWNKNMEKMNIS